MQDDFQPSVFLTFSDSPNYCANSHFRLFLRVLFSLSFIFWFLIFFKFHFYVKKETGASFSRLFS